MSDCRFGVSPVNYPDPDPDLEVEERHDSTRPDEKDHIGKPTNGTDFK